jgi:hypothetical protein
MKHLTFLTVLLLAPLASLHAAPPENSARLDQSALHEAVLTSMERLDRGSEHVTARLKALEYLSHLTPPVPPEVAIALAVALSDQDKTISQAAQRAAEALHLKLDVPALLLEGLSSDNAAVRVGSMTGIASLQLPPEQIQAKMVDALMKNDPFARNDVKLLISMMGEPLEAAVLHEIQTRYDKAKADQEKVALLRALGHDSAASRARGLAKRAGSKKKSNFAGIEKPMAGAVPILHQALSDSSAAVRMTAIQSLRWLESPLNWGYRNGKPVPNLFRDQPEQTDQIVKALQVILQTDNSVACRAEAVGCLAELRQDPQILIAALSDKEAAVRSVAAQGLCNYERAQLQGAISALQELTSDAACKTDASATLSYIQDQAAQAVIDSKGKNHPPALSGLSPEEVLKETARRAESAAKLSLSLQADRIPALGIDVFSHFSAQLCLNRNRAAANARLRQQLRFYSTGDLAGLFTGTKLPLVYALHYSKSRYFPGTFEPETEELFKRAMFSYVDWHSKIYFDKFVKDVMLLPGTENQSLQYRYGLWFLDLALLNEDPTYASRMLRGGKTVAQYYAEWNAFMKQWMRTKALNGFWLELGSHYSGSYSLPAILEIYTAATDPETRQLTKMFLDLALVEEAQAGYGDVRGGSKNRIKNPGIYGTFDSITQLLYEGLPLEGRAGHALATGDYRAPAVAVLLRNFEQYPRQPIAIVNRRLGEVRPAKAVDSHKVGPAPRTETVAPAESAKAGSESDEDETDEAVPMHVTDSKAVNYIWKTRNYMLGSMLRDPKTVMGVLYNNCPWNGLIFADGTGLFPDTYSRYYSFQHKNVFFLQPHAQAKTPVATLISSKLEKGEENGWLFLKNGDAYAGIKILAGGHTLATPANKNLANTFLSLVPEVPTSPIVFEAGDKDEFGSFEGFKAAVQANTITVSADKVEYSGPKQPRIEFYFESTGKASKVDGKPFSPDPVFVYSSPFMQRKEGESIVTVTVGGKRVLYDFDKAFITEASGPK